MSSLAARPDLQFGVTSHLGQGTCHGLLWVREFLQQLLSSLTKPWDHTLLYLPHGLCSSITCTAIRNWCLSLASSQWQLLMTSTITEQGLSRANAMNHLDFPGGNSGCTREYHYSNHEGLLSRLHLDWLGWAEPSITSTVHSESCIGKLEDLESQCQRTAVPSRELDLAKNIPAIFAMSAGWGAPTLSNLNPAFFSMKGMSPSFRLSTRVKEMPVHPGQDSGFSTNLETYKNQLPGCSCHSISRGGSSCI